MHYTRADTGVTGQRSYRRFLLEAQAEWRMETVPTYVTGQDE